MAVLCEFDDNTGESDIETSGFEHCLCELEPSDNSHEGEHTCDIPSTTQESDLYTIKLGSCCIMEAPR